MKTLVPEPGNRLLTVPGSNSPGSASVDLPIAVHLRALGSDSLNRYLIEAFGIEVRALLAVHLQAVLVVPLDPAVDLLAVGQDDDHRGLGGHLLEVVVALRVGLLGRGCLRCANERVGYRSESSERFGRISLRLPGASSPGGRPPGQVPVWPRLSLWPREKGGTLVAPKRELPRKNSAAFRAARLAEGPSALVLVGQAAHQPAAHPRYFGGLSERFWFLAILIVTG